MRTAFISRWGKSQGGFTLIELLVVVGIIVALAAVVVPQVVQFSARGD
jgi:prepilin-type N-terminal cleavage/methylation domain-containing protein